PSELDHVAEAASRHESARAELALEDRVRRQRGAVDEVAAASHVHAARLEPVRQAALLDGGGQHLRDPDLRGRDGLAVHVGEGAADVDAEAHVTHTPALPRRRRRAGSGTSLPRVMPFARNTRIRSMLNPMPICVVPTGAVMPTEPMCTPSENRRRISVRVEIAIVPTQAPVT